MKIILAFLVCLLLFINCSRKENAENIINNEINVENIQNENIDYEQIQFINENYYTLSEIIGFILNDLNLVERWFSSVDDIIDILNIPNNYNLNIFIQEFPPHDTVFEVYTFEWPFYRLRFHKYDESNYYVLEYITIEINHENILHLFP